VWQNFGNLFTQGTVLNGEMGPEWSAFGVGDFNGGVGGNTGLEQIPVNLQRSRRGEDRRHIHPW
jgi:hypothetical protein